MTLTIDDTIITFDAWTHELSESDWLYSLWGILPGQSSPRRTWSVDRRFQAEFLQV